MAEKSVVRELVTVLGWDVDEKTLSKYETRVESLKKNLRRLTIAAGLTGAAITGIAVKTARAGDNLVKTSQRLGLTIKQLQEWRFAAARSRIETATFDMAIQRFGRRFAEASRGEGEAIKALARLRVATRDETGQIRDLDEALSEALIKLGEWPNETERNALAMKLFDSEGVRLVQLAEQGEKGIAKLRNRFRELGGALSEEGARRAVEANDAWTDFTTSINGVIFAIGTELLPVITDLLSALTDWVMKNRTLLTIISWLTLGIMGLTTAVLGIIVVWKTWAVFIALVDTGLVLTIAKVVALIALFGVFVLIGEDIARFLGGTADSVTGRAVTGLKKIVAGLIESWKQKVLELLDLLPDELFWTVMDTFALIRKLWDGFVSVLERGLRAAIDRAIPPEVIAAVNRIASRFATGGQVVSAAERSKAELGTVARKFGAAQLREIPRSGVPQAVNITVNQTAGETGLGVTKDVAEGLLGQGVVAPLNGLAP
jgi:hypothetical protein